MRKKEGAEGDSFCRGFRDGFCRSTFPMGQLIRESSPEKEGQWQSRPATPKSISLRGRPRSNVYGDDSLLDK